MPVFDAILPAGGKIPEPFAGRAGTDVKALIKFGEETILHRTVRVLRDTGVIGRIVVIGGDKVRADASSVADSVLEEANSGPENILKGLKYLLALPDPPSKVFVITTDLPFLTAELLKTYIALCPANKDISVPLVSKAEWVEAYPNSSARCSKTARESSPLATTRGRNGARLCHTSAAALQSIETKSTSGSTFSARKRSAIVAGVNAAILARTRDSSA